MPEEPNKQPSYTPQNDRENQWPATPEPTEFIPPVEPVENSEPHGPADENIQSTAPDETEKQVNADAPESVLDNETASLLAIEIEPTTVAEPAIIPSLPISPTPIAAIAPAKKKSKAKVVIVSLALAVLLLSSASVAAYNLWYQNPDKVLADALINTINAKSVRHTGEFVYEQKGEGSDTKLTIKFDGKADRANGIENVDAAIKTGGETYALKASLLYDENTNFYFKISNLKEIVQQYAAKGLTLPQSATDLVNSIENKWVKVGPDDYKEWDEDFAKTQTCSDKVIRDAKNDDALFKEIGATYDKHRFVVVSKKLGAKDGNLGYEIDIDNDKIKGFVTELNQTKLLKQLQKCDKETYTLSADDFEKREKDPDETYSVKVWVSRWNHSLKELSYDYSNTNMQITSSVSPIFNQPTAVDVPKETISLSVLMDKIEALQKEYLGDFSTNTASSEAAANAATVAKKAEVYYALTGKYPTLSELKNGNKAVPEAAIDAKLKGYLYATAPTAVSPNIIQYTLCAVSGASGATIVYYDAKLGKTISTSVGVCTGSAI